MVVLRNAGTHLSHCDANVPTVQRFARKNTAVGCIIRWSGRGRGMRARLGAELHCGKTNGTAIDEQHRSDSFG